MCGSGEYSRGLRMGGLSGGIGLNGGCGGHGFDPRYPNLRLYAID